MILLDLLDANTLITANRDYYPLDQVPEFWTWLKYQGESGLVKIPQEIMNEVKAGRKENDPLIDWITQSDVETALLLEETVDVQLVRYVTDIGYGTNLTDVELETIGKDPFLIAYALAKPAERGVVTVEVSRPSARRQNRRIPDVCKDVGVQWCGPFAMNKRLGFKTWWNSA